MTASGLLSNLRSTETTTIFDSKPSRFDHENLTVDCQESLFLAIWRCLQEIQWDGEEDTIACMQ